MDTSSVFSTHLFTAEISQETSNLSLKKLKSYHFENWKKVEDDAKKMKSSHSQVSTTSTVLASEEMLCSSSQNNTGSGDCFSHSDVENGEESKIKRLKT